MWLTSYIEGDKFWKLVDYRREFGDPRSNRNKKLNHVVCTVKGFKGRFYVVSWHQCLLVIMPRVTCVYMGSTVADAGIYVS